MNEAKIIFYVSLSCLLLGCEHPNEEHSTPQTAIEDAVDSSLSLEISQGVLSLKYVRASDSSGPRIVDVHIRHSGGLQLLGHEAGWAAMEAGKQVVAQEVDSHTFRVIVLSTYNTLTLNTGTLAKMKLETEGEGPFSAEILLNGPVFAPAEAMNGLKVGEALAF